MIWENTCKFIDVVAALAAAAVVVVDLESWPTSAQPPTPTKDDARVRWRLRMRSCLLL